MAKKKTSGGRRDPTNGVPDPVALATEIRAGDRRALARAITLVESTRGDHQEAAADLLGTLMPETGRSTRVGISGVPGVGKSTFIEAFGGHIIDRGHRVAVLAVDPSSRRSGGSILGDKTRMETLARDEAAFIRPSPAAGTLGGVARRTREAILLCEAAGFDVILVETVGVGQSEVAVAEMVDMFVLLLLPGGGDELQGIKRGIMELADLVLVNKADGEFAKAAARAAAEYKGALHLLRPASPAWTPRVRLCSALTGDGIPGAWEAVGEYMAAVGDTGELQARRSDQALAWMWSAVGDHLLAAFRDHPAVGRELPALEDSVARGELPPVAAARRLLAVFRDG